MTRHSARLAAQGKNEPEAAAESQLQPPPRLAPQRTTKKRRREDDVEIDEDLLERQLDEEFGAPPRKRVISRKPAVASDVLAFSLNDIPDAMRQKYQANEQTRLLQLPPEIRNRIFEYVLGGNTIHVYAAEWSGERLRKDRKLNRSKCAREQEEQEDADGIKERMQNGASSLDHLGYQNRHSKCRHTSSDNGWLGRDKDTTTMNLGLLLVCRQIHNETALVPFRNNVFNFNWVIDLEAFVSHLIPTQVAAVEHISFVLHNFKSNQAFSQMLQRQLSGLKSLVIFAQFHQSRVVHFGVHDQDFMQDVKYKKAIEYALLRFAHVAQDSTTVAATNSHMQLGGQSVNRGSIPTSVLAEWARDMEKKLTK